MEICTLRGFASLCFSKRSGRRGLQWNGGLVSIKCKRSSNSEHQAHSGSSVCLSLYHSSQTLLSFVTWHLTHTKCTHTAVNTHTHREQLGVRCLAQGSHLSRGIEGEESAVQSLPPPTIPAGPETRTHNLWVTSPTLTIRPWLPYLLCPHTFYFCWSWSGNTLNSYYCSHLGLMFRTNLKNCCPATFFNWRNLQISAWK